MFYRQTILIPKPPLVWFQLQSALQMLKGRVYEKLDNRTRAADCFKQALRLDVYCYEAFQALVQHQMLTASEGRDSVWWLSLSGLYVGQLGIL